MSRRYRYAQDTQDHVDDPGRQRRRRGGAAEEPDPDRAHAQLRQPPQPRGRRAPGRPRERGRLPPHAERVFARGVEPTVRARFEETAEGLRIEGEAGIAPAVVWLLRLNYLFATLVCVGVGVGTVTSGEPAWISLLFAAMVVLATGAIGWNVSRAEERTPELARLLESTLMEGSDATDVTPVAEPLAAGEPDEERRRRARASRVEG
jgi:hypothetical protein